MTKDYDWEMEIRVQEINWELYRRRQEEFNMRLEMRRLKIEMDMQEAERRIRSLEWI